MGSAVDNREENPTTMGGVVVATEPKIRKL
jgi:hypothetical protein